MLVAAQPVSADPRLTLRSNITWDVPAPWFGGFSGIEAAPGGQSITIISDRGSIVEARLVRRAGSITNIEITARSALRPPTGERSRKALNDVEGIAIGTDGKTYLSFEGRHRVAALNPVDHSSTALPSHPDFDQFSVNKGLEALAVHPDGRLFALSERAIDSVSTTPIYQYKDGRWIVSHRIALQGPFVPVGADFDTDGRLYLLERALSPLGFRSRIRRFDLDTVPLAGETLLSTAPGVFDNLEGITVWRDRAGQTRLMMISDDNFLPVQRTQIVEFSLTE